MSENQPELSNEPLLNNEMFNSSAHLSQQKAVIQITEQALLSSNLNKLMQETIEIVRTILNVEFGEILQFNLDQNHLKLQSNSGWPEEFQQKAQTMRDVKEGSLYDYALQNFHSVVSSDLIAEHRFKMPEIYLESMIHSCMCAAIQGKNKPYGLLSVFSTKPRIFSSIEINFIQKIANLLALFIDRRRIESSLSTSQGELAFILDGIAEGVTIQVAGGKLIYANDIAARLLGFNDRVELLSKPTQELLSGIQFFYENGEVIPPDQFSGRRVLHGEEKVSDIYRITLNESGIERWLLINSAELIDTFKQERMALNIFQDITPIKQNEDDQRFLAALGDVLARTVSLEEVTKQSAEMAVHHFADWCVFHLVEDDIEVHIVAIAHKNPQNVAMALDLQMKYPPGKTAYKGIYHVIKTGQVEFYPEITDIKLKKECVDEEQFRIVSHLGLHSAMVLPMISRGQSLGTVTLVWAESKQKYSEREKYLGQKLAQRAALAIDNIRLHQQARTLNDELENKVLQRTEQLEQSNAKLENEISERIQVQRDLERSKALFSDLFELSPDAIFLVNQNGHILRVNDQAASIFGYQKHELIGHDIEKLLPDHTRHAHTKHRLKYNSDLQRRVMGVGFELRGRRKDGGNFPVDVMLSPVKIEDDWLVISVVRDITEQKITEAELAEVQHRLLDSQETERLMLAQELHDGTIQELFSINFQLADIGNDIQQAGLEKTGEKLKNASEMTHKVVQGLRNISRDLRPPALAPFGLEQAIYSHLEHFHELHPEIELHTEIFPDGQSLEENLRLIMFRIYQNAVINVARHAEANQLWVRFDLKDNQLTLEVEDNGKGFNIPKRWVELVRKGHLGLVGMRERVEAIGGNLTITSAPDKGTLIRVVVPIK